MEAHQLRLVVQRSSSTLLPASVSRSLKSMLLRAASTSGPGLKNIVGGARQAAEAGDGDCVTDSLRKECMDPNPNLAATSAMPLRTQGLTR